MKKYYLHNGTEQIGPFSLEDLATKNITKDTEIWYEGLTDWTKAEKLDELEGVFKLISPPPIKKRETSTPSPINKMSSNEKIKKTTSWKSIFIKSAIACILIFGGMAIYSSLQNSGSSYDESYSANSYEEQKMTVAEIERLQPTKFLSADGTYRENFLGNKLKVNGTITNSATVVSYKDAIVRVTYYSKTKTNLGSEDYTIWEEFPPNQTKNFKLKIKNYNNVNSIGWEVINAEVY